MTNKEPLAFYCRLCFEVDEAKSDLLAPCNCKGSSLFVHKHCLECWQRVSFDNCDYIKAFRCQICRSLYKHPPLLILCYQIFAHFIINKLKSYFAYLSASIFNLAIKYLKMTIYAILMLITLPWGHLSLGKVSISWIGYEFPPKLAIVCSSADSSRTQEISSGTILVSSYAIPSSSVFHRCVLLVLEYSVEAGARGVILNRDFDYHRSNQSPLNASIIGGGRNDWDRDSNLFEDDVSIVSNHKTGYGGPLEKHHITVVHDCADLMNESDFNCISEEIFISEYGGTTGSVDSLLNVKSNEHFNRLLKICHATARRTRRAAASYANKAIENAFLSTRNAVKRVSESSSRSHGHSGFDILSRKLAGKLANHSDEFINSLEYHIKNSRVFRRSFYSRSESEEAIQDRLNSTFDSYISSNKLRVNTSNMQSSNNGSATHSPNAFATTGGRSTSSTDHTDGSDEYFIPDEEDTHGYSAGTGLGLEDSPIQANILVLKGFSQWCPLQLEGELSEGLWHILPLKHNFIFPDEPLSPVVGSSSDDMWSYLSRELGVDTHINMDGAGAKDCEDSNGDTDIEIRSGSSVSTNMSANISSSVDSSRRSGWFSNSSEFSVNWILETAFS